MPSVISLCPGMKLAILCNSTDVMSSLGILQWNVTLSHNAVTAEDVTTRSVAPSSPQMVQLTISNIVFDITRDSTDGTVPVVSTLSVTNVTVALNGTIVECTTDEVQALVMRNIINIIRTGREGNY